MRDFLAATALSISALALSSTALPQCMPYDGSWPQSVEAVEAVHQGQVGAWVSLKPDVAVTYLQQIAVWNYQQYDLRLFVLLADHCLNGQGSQPRAVGFFVPGLRQGTRELLFEISSGDGDPTSAGPTFSAPRTIEVQRSTTTHTSIPALSGLGAAALTLLLVAASKSRLGRHP